MRMTLVERSFSRLNDVGWRWKIRLPDFQVDDVPALSFERPCPAQYIERSLDA